MIKTKYSKKVKKVKKPKKPKTHINNININKLKTNSNSAAIATIIYDTIFGSIKFTSKSNYVEMNVHFIRGLDKNTRYGLYIHKYGDMRETSESFCNDYNINNLIKEEGYIGDIGSFKTNSDGNCIDFIIKTKKIKIDEILGKSAIIFKDNKNLGLCKSINLESTSLKIVKPEQTIVAYAVIGVRATEKLS